LESSLGSEALLRVLFVSAADFQYPQAMNTTKLAEPPNAQIMLFLVSLKLPPLTL